MKYSFPLTNLFFVGFQREVIKYAGRNDKRFVAVIQTMMNCQV